MVLLKNCFCCSLRTVCLIVAWLEVLQILGTFFFEYWTVIYDDVDSNSAGVPFDHPLFGPGVSIIILIFGILLLVGIYKRNTRCIYVYFILSLTGMILLVATAVFHVVSIYVHEDISLGCVGQVCGILLIIEAILLLKVFAVYSLHQVMKSPVKATTVNIA